jgi:hypothetical protein
MELAQQLHANGLGVFPVKANKHPAVKGWQNPLPPEQYHWPSSMVGVPVPDQVVILDHDDYKEDAATLADIEHRLSARLGQSIDPNDA